MLKIYLYYIIKENHIQIFLKRKLAVNNFPSILSPIHTEAGEKMLFFSGRNVRWQDIGFFLEDVFTCYIFFRGKSLSRTLLDQTSLRFIIDVMDFEGCTRAKSFSKSFPLFFSSYIVHHACNKRKSAAIKLQE